MQDALLFLSGFACGAGLLAVAAMWAVLRERRKLDAIARQAVTPENGRNKHRSMWS